MIITPHAITSILVLYTAHNEYTVIIRRKFNGYTVRQSEYDHLTASQINRILARLSIVHVTTQLMGIGVAIEYFTVKPDHITSYIHG